jgi:hypothetical protein
MRPGCLRIRYHALTLFSDAAAVRPSRKLDEADRPPRRRLVTEILPENGANTPPLSSICYSPFVQRIATVTSGPGYRGATIGPAMVIEIHCCRAARGVW